LFLGRATNKHTDTKIVFVERVVFIGEREREATEE